LIAFRLPKDIHRVLAAVSVGVFKDSVGAAVRLGYAAGAASFGRLA
jgi:hypothetical protein